MEGDLVTGDIARDTLWRGLTPHGRSYEMSVRPGTSDWNTANACAGTNDEYHLPADLRGWALDVGAHIGACSIPLLLDDPELRVIAIEALPENVALLRRNAERNGVMDRLTVVEGAASDRRVGTTTIHYAPDEPVHEFIGNRDGDGRPGIKAENVSLSWCLDQIWRMSGVRTFAWTKIDCEGCEHAFLASGDVGALRHIEGEHHPPEGIDRVRHLLRFTHDVEHMGGTEDFGAFRAVARVAVPA